MRGLLLTLGLLLGLGCAGLAQAESTQHRIAADTGIETWTFRADTLSVSLTQSLSDQSLGFFLGRGFPRAAAERYASACVFMSIVRNPGKQPLEFDLDTWRVHGLPGVEHLKTRDAWLQEWRAQGLGEAQRIAFEWSQLPTIQGFEPGDWNQGMTSVSATPGSRFDLELHWRVAGQAHVGTIKGVRCAPR